MNPILLVFTMFLPGVCFQFRPQRSQEVMASPLGMASPGSWDGGRKPGKATLRPGDSVGDDWSCWMLKCFGKVSAIFCPFDSFDFEILWSIWKKSKTCHCLGPEFWAMRLTKKAWAFQSDVDQAGGRLKWSSPTTCQAVCWFRRLGSAQVSKTQQVRDP